MQIAGQPGDDDRVLEVAARFQTETSWHIASPLGFDSAAHDEAG